MHTSEELKIRVPVYRSINQRVYWKRYNGFGITHSDLFFIGTLAVFVGLLIEILGVGNITFLGIISLYPFGAILTGVAATVTFAIFNKLKPYGSVEQILRSLLNCKLLIANTRNPDRYWYSNTNKYYHNQEYLKRL